LKISIPAQHWYEDIRTTSVVQFFEFINNYRGSEFLINYFKTLQEPAILTNKFCGPIITRLFSKTLWLYTRPRLTVMNLKNSPDNRKLSDSKTQQNKIVSSFMFLGFWNNWNLRVLKLQILFKKLELEIP
jgi:hypothetical protein